MSALSKCRSAATLPLLQNMFETLTARDLKQSALNGIGRSESGDTAATFLIRVSESDPDMEIRKSAIANLGMIAGQKSLGALTIQGDGQG